MQKMTGVTRIARNAVIGVLAVAAAALVLPGSAEAGSGSGEVAIVLGIIADDVDHLPKIRGLRRQDAEIDRLQARLHRLDRISDRQRGRRARRNHAKIDRLQHRLHQMERRIEARIERRRHRRDDRRADHRRDHRHSSGFGFGNAWRY